MCCAAQRARAFSTHVLPYRSEALALARALTSSEPDAEEIAQEAMLRAWKYFEAFQAASALPWLLAIVRNTFKTWRARRDHVPAARRLPRPRAVQPPLIPRLALSEAVKRLPVELRTVFLSCDVAGLSCAEVSARTGTPTRTVSGRLRRARMELRKMLREFR